MTVSDAQGVMNVMDAMTIPYFVGGSTNTAEALNQVVNRLFQSKLNLHILSQTFTYIVIQTMTPTALTM